MIETEGTEQFKKQLLETAQEVYKDAIYANNQLSLLKQLGRFLAEDTELANIAPAYFQLQYCAVRDSVLIAIGRLYTVKGEDYTKQSDKDSYQVYRLLKMCEDSPCIFKESRLVRFYDASDESKFIDEEIKSCIRLDKYQIKYCEKALEEVREIAQFFGASESDYLPYQYSTTPEGIFKIFRSWLNDLKVEDIGKLDKQIKLRNKTLAHNAIMDGELELKIQEIKNDINIEDLQTLISLALQLQTYVIADRTDVQKPYLYANIRDFSNLKVLLSKGINNNSQ